MLRCAPRARSGGCVRRARHRNDSEAVNDKVKKIMNFVHGGIALTNRRIYLGTGPACESASSGKYVSPRGRVVSVDPGSVSS